MHEPLLPDDGRHHAGLERCVGSVRVDILVNWSLSTRCRALAQYILPFSFSFRMQVPIQYTKGDWDWFVMSGGGNILLFGCGFGKCDGTLDRLPHRS